MIRIAYRSHEGKVYLDLPMESLEKALRDRKGLVWVDMCEETKEACEPLLLNVFQFHPLAVEDALEEAHSPKSDDWGHYVYMVLHAVALDLASDELLSTVELDVFLGPNYVVTHQEQVVNAVSRVWKAYERDERYFQRGAGHLLYRISDELVDAFMPVIEHIDDMIDTIEDAVFDDPQQKLLEQIFTIKRATLHMRRIIAPQREVFNKLARGDYPVLQESDEVFFRDVYDHLVRLHDISEGLRELVSGALDTYLSVVNNRMNDVMKTLTVITTLFMPLSFMTGYFGMNFFQPVTNLDIWTNRPVFIAVILLMVAIPLGMFLWMRRRGWMS